MKRGIPIALQAAGAVLACLVSTLNHPVVANERTVYQDTVHYYNKHGREIYCYTKSDTPGNYIIRTSKIREQLFDDVYSPGRERNSEDYQPAHVFNITRNEARKVKRLIRRGNIKDTMVVRCIVPIIDKCSLLRMLDSIKTSRANYKSDGSFREYGGMINGDTSFVCLAGDSTDPRRKENKGVHLKVGKKGNFHSHPEGEVKDAINGKTYSFVQGPSLDDETYLDKKTGYVFAMRNDTQLIYVFDGRGVLAMLPFKCLLFKSVKK